MIARAMIFGPIGHESTVPTDHSRVDHAPDRQPIVTPVVDVIIPVYNEEVALPLCIGRLHDYLLTYFPYPFRITIADNASTDNTWSIAQRLDVEYPAVRAIHLDQKGRGRALKRVWSESDAPILAYMDVDLSTDLDAFWPLIAPLMSGHSDVAIGSRLHRDSRVIRGAKREFISRTYNIILRAALGARFSDAQCGFKAIRADVARELLPLVEDPTWFFDTELLVLAERCRLRVHEVPVDWWDDPDSRVNIVATATDDLRGVVRMRRSFASGALPTGDIASRLGRLMPAGEPTGSQLLRFLAIGGISLIFQLGLFAVLSSLAVDSQVANAIALVTATVVNTAANRRWTFGVRGRRRAATHQAWGLALLGVALAITAAALAVLHAATPGASTLAEVLVVAGSTVAATGVKFVVMRRWVFAQRDSSSSTSESTTTAEPSAACGGEVGGESRPASVSPPATARLDRVG